MKFLSVALVAIASACVNAQELTRCGAPNPPAELMEEAITEPAVSRRASTRYNVDTYVHVITSQAKKDLYPRSMVEEQIRVMNAAYSGSRFGFNLKNVDYTVNDTWASALPETPTELQYKKALKKGTYKDLDLYFLSDLGGGLLGFCYFPEKKPTAEQRTLDGCVNLAGSMPGGETRNYNLGATAVHEVGHWLGLFHTFQGSSCTGAGDYVPDTPRQLNATSGCPSTSDTCPKSPGLDPIHNYMDYSYDSCMYEFSRLQSLRMRVMYHTRRRRN